MPEAKTEIQRIENVTALAAISRVEIDGLVATAKEYPRSIKRFTDTASEMTLSSVEFAGQSFYAIPRGGKWISGPSIRFAETLQHAWGNCRAAARVTEEQAQHVVAQGVFIDCEVNTMVSIEQKRKIVDREGNRYNADMITTTGNAACSIALRNAILRGIPKALWSPIYDRIEGVITDPKLLAATRTKALAYFANKGVKPERVCALVNVESVDKIGPKEIFLLRGLSNSIDEGEVTVDHAFRNSKAAPSMPRELKQPESKVRKTPAPARKNEPTQRVATINEKQRVELFDIARKLTNNTEDMIKLVHTAIESFGFKQAEDVTVDRYDSVVSALRGEN